MDLSNPAERKAAEDILNQEEEEEDDLEPFVLWSGGSWWWHEDIEYTGKNLAKHVFKLSLKNLTYESIFKHARKELGLPIEERFRLTYEHRIQIERYPDREFILIDIVREQDFKLFMNVVHTLSRPITLYHGNLNGPIKLVGSEEADEVDAGGSQLLIDRMSTAHSSWMGEESHIHVPNDKVAVLFGKGGQIIKNMLTGSGARIQLFSECFERRGMMALRVIGDRRQLEIAEEMIMQVIYKEKEEVNELESWVLWSGGEWDTTVMEYKGENVVKHILNLPSMLTWPVLELHMRKELCLDESLKLTYPYLPLDTESTKPVDLTDHCDFAHYMLAVAKNLVPQPLTLYNVKISCWDMMRVFADEEEESSY